jgi:hypothetical protein
MNKYYLTVIGSNTSWDAIVEAEYFHTTTNNSTTSDYYAFYSNGELVACYPINRTIIYKVERNNEQ